MFNPDLLARGKWLLGSEANPAVSGEYLVLVKDDDGTFRESTLEFNHEDVDWFDPKMPNVVNPRVVAWLLPEGEAFRPAGIIRKAREILESVPIDRSEVSPSGPALYDHVAAIRYAKAILGKA